MNVNIEKIKQKMIIRYPFFGSTIANVDLVATDKFSTAATDGKVIFYNPNFFDNLPEGQQIFVLTHEVLHIVHDHPRRSKGKNEWLWWRATDAVINALLQQDGLELAEDGINIPGAENYSIEELYEKLLKEAQSKQENNLGNQNSNEQQNDNNQEGYVGHASHSLWSEAIKELEIKGQLSEINLDNKAEKEISKMEEKEVFINNREMRRAQLKELMHTISKGAKGFGSETNSEQVKISHVGNAKSLIDWRRILREAISINEDWSYKNAVIKDGIIRSHLKEIPESETEILLDTSGSVSDVLIKNFLRECKSIIKTSKIKVGCFDTKFYGFKDIKTEKDIDNINFIGRGGTDFNVAINSFSKRVANKIIFTDGKSDMPDVLMDAVWIVYGDEEISPKGGRIIYITKEQLKKLSEQEPIR